MPLSVQKRGKLNYRDVPDTAALYEFYGTALLQRSLQQDQGNKD